MNDHLRATPEENSIVVDAGGGEFDQKLHDLEYWNDPDNVPDELAYLQVTHACGCLLKNFVMENVAIVGDLVARCQSHIDF